MDELRIKKYSDDDLLLSLGGLFDGERRTDRLILLHLLEIESRKLYAKRGFDSLFSMLIGFFKLSEGSANRRLQAMRLLKVVPEAQESLVTGEVNLMTLSMAQSQIRRQEKLTGEKVSVERKAEIVERIKNKSQSQAEVELFRLLPETALSPRNEERRISETETRLSHNFPDRVLNKLKRLREIWSHIDPNMDYVEIIERCADETLKRVDPAMKKGKRPLAADVKHGEEAKPRNSTLEKPIELSVPHDGTFKKLNTTNLAKQCATTLAKHRVTSLQLAYSPVGPKNKRVTYYTIDVRNKIYSRAESCCEWVDDNTGRRCRSRYLLQIDHIVPIWAGGSNDPANLQLLCAGHNRLKYEIETNQTFLSDRFEEYRAG